MRLRACVPACRRAGVPACLRACVPACLRACAPARLRACAWEVGAVGGEGQALLILHGDPRYCCPARGQRGCASIVDHGNIVITHAFHGEGATGSSAAYTRTLDICTSKLQACDAGSATRLQARL